MIVSKNGISKRGDKVTVFSRDLCKKIRKRLNLTQKDLTNETIAKIISTSNKETAKWLLENTEGFKVHRDMGYLAISKFLPKEFREDQNDILEKIRNLDVHPKLKEKLLKRYGRDIENSILLKGLFKGNVDLKVDYSRFFYCHKFMWFNKRNCSIKKARVYKFDGSRLLREELRKILKNTKKEYEEHNFDDFYFRKMKPIE